MLKWFVKSVESFAALSVALSLIACTDYLSEFKDEYDFKDEYVCPSFIHSSFAELAPSKYDQPAIIEAFATVENGRSAIFVALNTSLDSNTMARFWAQAANNADAARGGRVDLRNTSYALLARRVEDGQEQVFGVLLTGFKEILCGADDPSYEFDGVLVNEMGQIIESLVRNGDGLAFNYTDIDLSRNKVYEYWYTHAIDVVSASGKKVDSFPLEWPTVKILTR